ncbi:MAG: hypothetical protein Q9195_000806 [Heterodermia aff. obscurata]
MWKPLSLANRNQSIPCLLVKCDFGSTNYTIHLTDLTYIWTESLDRKQIIRRALEVNTSIDPSENGSQLRLLLGHIERSFAGLSGTSLSLRGRDSSSKLLLNISVELPAPLAPLEWPLYMMQAPQNSLTSHFVLPCLSQVVSLRDRIDSLLQHLREKDNVIRKLTDKILSDGTDLSRVFPGAASVRGGSRLSAREAFSKSVKGMADFDQQEWREHTFANSNAPDSIHELVNSAFPSDHGDAQVLSQAIDSQSHWWDHLQPGESLPTTTQSNLSTHNAKAPQSPQLREIESSFDGFQRQSTPSSGSPKADSRHGAEQMRQNSLKPDSVNGGTTTDDSANDDLEHQDRPTQGQASKAPSTRSRSPKSSTGGEIRASAKSACNAAPMPTSARRVSHSTMTSSTAKGTESEDDQHPPPTEAVLRASTSSAVKARHKLGKIGIRKKKQIQDDSEEDIPAHRPILDDVSGQTESPSKKPKHKLGKIGRKAYDKSKDPLVQNTLRPLHRDESFSNSEHTTPSRVLPKVEQDSPIVKKSTVGSIQESPRKISDIQANENRERLKRELDAKSSNTKKKKRKF